MLLTLVVKLWTKQKLTDSRSLRRRHYLVLDLLGIACIARGGGAVVEWWRNGGAKDIFDLGFRVT